MAYSRPSGNDILNATFVFSSFKVTSHYMALFSTPPSETSSGTEMPYANGYTRRAFDSWTAASGSFIANNATLVWSATGVWSSAVNGIGMFSAGSAGTRVWQHTLTNCIVVASGDIVTWVSGDLQFVIASCAA